MIVDCAVYDDGGGRRSEIALDRAGAATANGFVWLDLEEATTEELAAVANEFDLDPGVLERARRPTLELLADRLVLVVQTACHVGPEQVECGELTVVAGRRFVVTVRRGRGASLAGARGRIESNGDLSHSGLADALRAILGLVIGDWERLVAGLYEDVDQLEALVLSPTRMYRADRLFTLMRALLRLHRSIAPLLSALEALEDAEHQPGSIGAELAPDARAWRARAKRLLADTDYLREHVTVALQIHESRAAARLAQVSVRHAELATHENEQMRKMAAWAAIIAVPTLIAGVYGMNFRDMPELSWSFGYPLAVGVMAALCLGLYWWFRRINWL
jgi:magnesium transporter